MKRRGVLITGLALLAAVSACDREQRRTYEGPAGGTRADTVRLTQLQPGQPSPAPPTQTSSPYKENAWGIAEGKRLFVYYNCNGCHAMGGGAIGPPLMDTLWIYGHDPGQIYSTILQGRPNGMPSFAGRIPDQQVWQLVAYVQSLSGAVPKDAAPGRDDDLAAKKPELRQEHKPARQTGHR